MSEFTVLLLCILIWSCAGFSGCIYRYLCLWGSTLWFLNQSILEISDSCINISLNIYSLFKNLLKLTFFLIHSCRFVYPYSTCLTWNYGTQWSLMSYFFCEHHLKDMVRRRTLHRQNTFHVLRPHFRWENLKHQVSLNEWLFYYQIYISQLGSQEQMQLFPGQWGMRLKADVQM